MKPIFVIGPVRSGTTLLISLLDNHSSIITIPMEIKFYDNFHELKNSYSYSEINNYFFKETKLRALNPNEQKMPDTMNTGEMDFSNFDFNSFFLLMKKNEKKYDDMNENGSLLKNYILDLHNTFNQVLGANQKKFFAVKEGNHGLAYIESIYNDFPDAKFVVMIRDPRQCYSSLKRISLLIKDGERHSSFSRKLTVNKFLFNKSNKGKTHFDYMKFFDKEVNDNFLFIKYEDLIRNPTQQMKNVSKFIGCNFEESLISPSVIGKAWYGNSSQKIISNKIYNNSSNQILKNNLNRKEIFLIESYLKKYMLRWGYDFENEKIYNFKKIIYKFFYFPKNIESSSIYRPKNLTECFYFDKSDINEPRKGFRKLWDLFFLSSFSMPVIMRISQYFYRKGWLGRVLGSFFRRLNEILNNFEHGRNPKIEKGVIFHHNSVCITSDTVIESGVHIYRNVTFGIKNGKAPYVKSKAKIASHSIILGDVVIGKKSIVSPGAVVLSDVPDGKVVAGIPAKVITDVNHKNYNF